MYSFLFKKKIKLLLRALFRAQEKSTAKFIAGVVVLSIFFLGAYYLFFRTFNYLVTVQDIGVMLIDKVISIGFLALGILLIVSNIITSISTLYRSDETSFLFSSPLSYNEVFFARFIDNLFFSSWATLVIGIPLFLAYAKVHSFPMHFYVIAAPIIFIPFVLIPAYIGVALSMLFFLATKRFGVKKVLIFLGAVAALAVFFILRYGSAASLLLNIEGDIVSLNYFLKNLGTTTHPFLPNNWIVEVLRGFRYGNTDSILLHSSLLLSSSAALWVLLSGFVSHLYYPSYLAALEVMGKQRRKRSTSMKEKGVLWNLLSVFPSDMRVFIIKDLKLFVRDTKQWSQFTILIVLLLLYLINLRSVPLNVTGKFWQTLITFGNFAPTKHTPTTPPMRFVYPSISMEGKSFWAIISTPFPARRLFWAKFWQAFIVFFIIAEIVVAISSGMLAQTGTMIFLTSIGTLLMSISLVSLSINPKTLFPSFEEPNPAKIASSSGGMITALVSLVYVGLMVIVMAVPTHRMMLYFASRGNFPSKTIILSVIFIVLLNIVATVVPIKLGLKVIKERDFC